MSVDISVLTEKTLGGLRVQTVEESSEFLNVLVYGDTGVGKTRFAGSAWEVEELRPILFIDVEGGTLTLKNTFPEVERVRVDTWARLDKVYGELHAMRHGFKTVVIDSLTELQRFNMEQIMDDLVTKGRSSGAEVNRDVPDKREWGISGSQIRRTVTGFRDLPMHTIMTCLEKQERNKRTGLETTKPALPGQMSSEVGGFFDEVLYMYMKNVPKPGGSLGEKMNQRFILTMRTDKEVAKDRSGKLPTIIEDPSFKKLYEMITSEPKTKP